MPRLEFIDRQKGTARLFVGGKPFVILGGELLNSSGSTASDMAKKWENLKALNLNTVILAVPWEQIENEIGLLGDSRDRSKNVDKVFSENVPSELVKSLKEKKDRLLPEIASAWEKNGRREVG